MFAIAAICCGQLMVNVYSDWQLNPAIVVESSDETFPWDFPFPAVTICPQHIIRDTDAFSYTQMVGCAIRRQTPANESDTGDGASVDDDESVAAAAVCANRTADDWSTFDALALLCKRVHAGLHPDLGPFAAADTLDRFRTVRRYAGGRMNCTPIAA